MKVKLIDKKCMPTKGYVGDAGWDLYARLDEPIDLYPNGQAIIPCGIAIEIPKGYYGNIKTRSSTAQRGLHIAEGVIDPNYRGEIKITVHNISTKHITIKPYERLAQLVLTRYYEDYEIEIVDDLSNTERGEKGFGSTGKF